MELNQILEKLDKKQKGSFFKLAWMTDVPITAQAKRDGNVVLKYSYNTMRFGISYKNLKSVKEKVEQGKELTHELSWGSWLPGREGLVIQHNGKYYIRLYTSPNKSSVTYFLNGRPITPEELQTKDIVQKSYWNKKNPDEKLVCITIKAENIQDIY